MKRIKYIDILRAIAIICVVIGHIPYPNLNPEIHKWLYAFHIPLFFFISGISLHFTNYHHSKLKTIFKKRFKRIYLPYLIWGIILALPNISLSTFIIILYGTHQSIASVSNSSLWFLPVLFCATILLDLILYRSHKQKTTKRLPLLLIVLLYISILTPAQTNIQNLLNGHNLPLGIDIVPMASFFMLSGFIFEDCRKNKKIKCPLIFIISLTTLCLFTMTYFSLKNDVDYVLMAENRYGNYLYFFIAAFSGIFASILVTNIITNYTKIISRLLQLIGSNTMTIFILHKYPLKLINDLVLLVPIPNISSFIIIPLYSIVTLIVCIPASSLIKKYTPFLIGGS